MKLNNPVRLGGLAAVLAGVLLAISQILGSLPFGFLPYELSGRELAIYGWGGIDTYLGILLMVLVQLGLVGLYARQARAAGVLGMAGFFVAFIGGRLALGPSFIGPVSKSSTWALAGSLWWLLTIYTLIFVLGWMLFGVATLRVGIYPRPAGVLLTLGTPILTLPLPLSGVIFAGAVAWMGYVLFTERYEEAP